MTENGNREACWRRWQGDILVRVKGGVWVGYGRVTFEGVWGEDLA